jgi:hypothetical protein
MTVNNKTSNFRRNVPKGSTGKNEGCLNLGQVYFPCKRPSVFMNNLFRRGITHRLRLLFLKRICMIGSYLSQIGAIAMTASKRYVQIALSSARRSHAQISFCSRNIFFYGSIGWTCCSYVSNYEHTNSPERPQPPATATGTCSALESMGHSLSGMAHA